MPIFSFPSRHTKKTEKKKSGPSYQRRAAKRSGTGGASTQGNVASQNESAEAKKRRLEAAIRRFARLKG